MKSCLVVTFNANKVKQTKEGVASHVLAEPLKSSATPADFLVISVQEVSPLYNALLDNIEEYVAPYIEAVPSNYKLVARPYTGGTVLLVFRHESQQIGSFYTKTSEFGTFWSSLKGAALLSIDLDGVGNRISFVACHLCADEGNKIPRNLDFETLSGAFELQELEGQIIIAGDLNYRSRNGSLRNDELTTEMSNNRVGLGYQENPITFKPTYKYERCTNKYKKGRVPSWCDRILYRSIVDTEGNKTTAGPYTAVYSDKIDSDHKPVYLRLVTPTASLPIVDFLKVEGSTERPEKLRGKQPLTRKLTLLGNLGLGTLFYLLTTDLGRVISVILLLVASVIYFNFYL